ncbi:cell division protein FtsA [Desulfatibacillum alkenivorans DSM 16219]|jgi:cell division protein FtsA|uniref:Cell division protein FtsA n=1 Tax=Desulfatibacillum alkenivorans DSM 16219 TaxID=1121393 RepID=A0A1M6E1P8_9BACT|nr:cell division protein FtsA [Desulfatibacillum alkenivorans]SHI79329.1 cell division protein FtsA [Desulfatibacillum alkenivorans DSM 16219]
MRSQGELIVGLDIGTTKICAAVGEVTEEGVQIVGIGHHPSDGLRKGVVVNIESTVESIRKAVQEAELMAGCDISNVYAGIAGGHVAGFNSNGIIAIKGNEITPADKERVLEAARAVAIPQDREIIHVLPQEYIVDGERGIRNPVGMAGVRLEANIHVVTGASAAAQNIVKCAQKADLDVLEMVLEPLASSEAVLIPEERDLGVALIDIGGGTTDLAVFTKNCIRHTYVLPLGGANLTNDISIGLRAPLVDAEKIKQYYGTCASGKIGKDDSIEIPGVGGRKARKLPRQILGEILEPRVQEMFELLDQELWRAGMKNNISSGVVLTGGAVLLDGMAEIAEQVFNVPARIGKPAGVTGLVDMVNSPMYATAVGLVLYGARNQNPGHSRLREKGMFDKLVNWLKKWFKDVV